MVGKTAILPAIGLPHSPHQARLDAATMFRTFSKQISPLGGSTPLRRAQMQNHHIDSGKNTGLESAHLHFFGFTALDCHSHQQYCFQLTR
jgi:hypothetical protein